MPLKPRLPFEELTEIQDTSKLRRRAVEHSVLAVLDW